MIAAALVEHGRLSRDELGRRIGARYWSPGRFRGALRETLTEGAARRAGRNLYAPPRHADSEGESGTPAPSGA